MKFGYVRVSTRGQARTGTSLDTQRNALRTAGVEDANIFADAGVSGAKSSRPALDEMLSRLREGDEVIVPSLSRLGRSLTDLMALVSRLREGGVTVRFLSEGFDTESVSGRLMIGIFGAVAEMEREQTLERTALGRQRARQMGRLVGRPKVYGAATLEQVRKMEENRSLTTAQRAAALQMPRSTYYRLLKQLRENGASDAA